MQHDKIIVPKPDRGPIPIPPGAGSQASPVISMTVDEYKRSLWVEYNNGYLNGFSVGVEKGKNLRG